MTSARSRTWLGFAGVLAACSTPQYTSDAGHADGSIAEQPADVEPTGARLDGSGGPQSDSGASTVDGPSQDAAVAPWHAALADRYAISIRFYSKNRSLADQAVYAHDIVMLATTTRKNGQVFMDAQRCADRGRVTGLGFEDEFWWPYAERLPLQQFEFVQRPDGIATKAQPRLIGFTEVADCAVGTKRRVDGRPWLPDGMCECRSEPLPITAVDCRVIDDDQDSRPGVTINHRGLLNEPETSRALDKCQFTQAKLAPDGHMSGYFLEKYEFYALDCAAGLCPRANILACPLELNPVQFEPLAAKADGSGWTCADVMSEVEAGGLFRIPMLTFVDGC